MLLRTSIRDPRTRNNPTFNIGESGVRTADDKSALDGLPRWQSGRKLSYF